MKQENIIILSTLMIFGLNGCAIDSTLSPSQNTELNVVSESQSHKEGYMQEHLDRWLKNEWEPTVKSVDKKYKKKKQKNKSFSIQEYVDKAILYHKKHPLDENASYYNKLNHLPVIGK